MREKVLHTIRERGLLHAGNRVAVAVSGGADSVALLRILIELIKDLGIVLNVAHYNHALRAEASDADEQFVTELAGHFDLPLFTGRGNVREHAAANKLSIEHAARELRYEWLIGLARGQRFEAVATAHTSDDQAETVLMKFLRGAGTRGLAGVHPALQRDGVRIVRPLLEASRAEVVQYLASIEQPWREDETNRDSRFTRNRIRHELLPLLERDYNPNLRALLSETADVALAEEDHWRAVIEPEFAARHYRSKSLQLVGFDHLHVALQRRLLKRFLEAENIVADFHHVEALRRCALGETQRVDLSGGWLSTKGAECLTLFQQTDAVAAIGYLYTLAIPGEVRIAEVGATIRASLVDHDVARQADPGTLLCAGALGSELIIRNWHPGDRFRPAHSGSEQKLKSLFSEKRVPADQRSLWPVALSGSQIVWVRGFLPAHDSVWTSGPGDAFRIDVLSDE